MQFTITRYDRARDKTGLKYYVCFFALLVDSGFFEGVKKVLHVGEVGFFRYFCVNSLMPSCPLFSVKFLFCFHWCSISTSVTSLFIFFSLFLFFSGTKRISGSISCIQLCWKKGENTFLKMISEFFRRDVNFFPKAD